MFTYWAMMLSVSGMYSMYIMEIGFTKAQVGVAASIFTFSTLIGQNLIGYLADRYKHVKKILLVSITIGIAAASALYFSSQVWFIYLMIFVWSVGLYGTVPLSEAWYIQVLKENGHENEFGKIRGFGSIGYGLSGVFLGYLLQSFGWSIYIFYILLSACFVLISILLVKDDKEIKFYKVIKGRKDNNTNVSFKEAMGQIASIKPLRSILVIIFMYSFVVKGIYVYLSVLVSDSGGGPLSLGLAYFFDASPELISFFLTSKLLKKYHSKSLIFASLIIQIIRLALILIFTSPAAIILLGSMSGFAYGLMAAAYKTYIYDLAPEKYKISCLSLSESIIGFSGVISAPVFGFVIMKFGTYSSIAMGLAIDIAIALTIGYGLIKKQDKKATIKA